MDNLPLELRRSIAQKLDQKSKLLMRTTSAEWSKIVQITDYTLYNISKLEWKEVVQRFEKKTDQIRSLSLQKNSIRKAVYLLPLITKLTQLTSLNINNRDGVENWMELTTLSNLKSCNLTSSSLDLSLKLPNLEEIYVPDLPEAQIEKLRSATKVQRLYFFFLEQYPLLPFEIISHNFVHLTQLIVTNHIDNGKDYFRGGCSNIFSQLRYLSWDTKYSMVEKAVSLHQFSALEDLYWSGSPLTAINSSNLTTLCTDHLSWNEISGTGSSALVNLKNLMLDLTSMNEVFSFKFLTALTALEAVSIDAHATTKNFLLNLVNSKKLTRLECHIRHAAAGISYFYLTRLTSLTSIDTWTYTNTELLEIGWATQLVDARISVQSPNPPINFSRLLNLENLTLRLENSQPKGNIIFPSSLTRLVLDFYHNLEQTLDLGNLPNLASLDIVYSKSGQYVGIEKLTKLGELKVKKTFQITDVKPDYLTNLPNLETFDWSLENPVLPYLVNAATKLRSLSIFYLKEDLENIAPFMNLTWLQICSLPDFDMANSCLTRLTKLQIAKFGAKNTGTVPVEEYWPYLYTLQTK